MKRILFFAFALLCLAGSAAAQVCPAGSTCSPFEAYTYGTSASSAPFGAALFIPAVPSATGSTMQHIPANSLATLTDTQTLTNKTVNCANNSCTVRIGSDVSGLGTSVATALGVNIGTAGAFAKNNGDALSGTYTGTPTFSGNLTFSGVPIFSGLSSGTQTKCLGLDASNNLVYNAAACGSGGGGGLTVGTTTITSGTNGRLEYNNSGVLGEIALAAGTANISLSGTANSTISTTVPLDTQSGNSAYTIVTGDNTKAVTRTNTVTQSDAIPQAGGSFPSGFAFGYSTATVGNTLTSTTSTINGIAGATGIKTGAQQEIGCNSDGTNWACLLGVPQPATQTGTTFLRDDMTWAEPLSREIPVGWIATVNPNNVTVFTAKAASTVTSIVGRVETATGSAATVSVNKAGSGTACSAGTTLHSGSFNANGTAATNQTLTVTTTSLAAGDSVCLQTTGTTSWTSGTGIGGITVSITTP